MSELVELVKEASATRVHLVCEEDTHTHTRPYVEDRVDRSCQDRVIRCKTASQSAPLLGGGQPLRRWGGPRDDVGRQGPDGGRRARHYWSAGGKTAAGARVGEVEVNTHS